MGVFDKIRKAILKPKDEKSLEVRIKDLREILLANNKALGGIGRMQEMLASSSAISPIEVRRVCSLVTVETYKMVTLLNRMTNNRHKEVAEILEELKKRIARVIDLGPVLEEVGYTVPLQNARVQMGEMIGQKNAYLGEVCRFLPHLVPKGFATSTLAYDRFFESAGLYGLITEKIKGLNPGDTEAIYKTASELVLKIESAELPKDLQKGLEEAVARLGAPRLAVRSSAIMEGGVATSFAGQYRSLLNIPPSGICDAFKKVLASKYTPEALSYRLARNLDDKDIKMCCCVVEMVDALCAGVAHSGVQRNGKRCVLVQAVKGLGLGVVSGSVTPDSYLVDTEKMEVCERVVSSQRKMLALASTEGTEWKDVPSEEHGSPALSDDMALEVGKTVFALEKEFGVKLEVEWAFDRSGKLYVLQVRPRSEGDGEKQTLAPIEGATILLQGGSVASRGAGFGTVFVVKSDLDILRCPDKSVVVLKEASPHFSVLLSKASAIVSETGSTTAHLAVIAREQKVPAIFGVEGATVVLKNGQQVTVDAMACAVYDGHVEKALERAKEEIRTQTGDSEGHRLLKALSPLICPLNLTGRLSSQRSAKSCRSVHDIIRYCHQMAIESLFEVGDKARRKGERMVRLVSPVPIDLRVLDLGGGLAKEAKDLDEVGIEHVRCRPMVALWKGMTQDKGAWSHNVQVSLGNFLTSIVNYNFDLDRAVRPMGEPSYAFITATYMNLNSRVGYHFTTIDATVCDIREKNYASFRFVGGAASVEQRARRALLIERILSSLGFECDKIVDLVNARIRYRPAEEMDRLLFILGRLLLFVNHLDMQLTSDEVVMAYQKAFLQENNGF